MKLNHLAQFIAAAELGSLRSASRHLGVAQPVITKSIRELEQECGVPLFERYQQGVRLTAMGDVFLRRALAIQSEVRRAREEIRQLSGDMTGEVSVALSAVSSFALMPKAVSSFRNKYPGAVLKVIEGFFPSVEAQILNGQIDFCVGPFRETNQSRFLVEKLFDHRWVVIARKGHPLSGKTRLEDLTEAEWVKPSLFTRSSEADIALPFERLGLPLPKVVVHTTSATTTLLAVAHSNLLTIMPRLMLSSPISAGRFDIFNLAEPLQGAPICLVRRVDLPLTPIAEYFSDMIRRVAIQIARHHNQ